MSTGETFWLVWSPTGHVPPSFRHESRENAIAEAERLARSRVGAEFFVLQATDLRLVDSMIRTSLVPLDEIPF
ncbi:DUF2188 domain-containing protein [Caballeronia cordobensis]|uniref:DUF2188 domain-containing protein n=1 Tax=Caballeronia cordobensis TaxID=1353886 RepID=UPI00045EFD3D|nr:uncharacterized protein BRPE67_BCDS10280 [Burkholderia sp. RPE67]